MKNKLKREAGNAAIGTAIIIIVMIIVTSAVFVWMYSVDLLFLPDFVEDILRLDRDSGEVVWDLGELSEIVRNGKNENGETVVFEDSYENLRAALLSEPAADGIYLSADVSHYSDGIPTVRRIRYYRDGERFRCEIYAPGDEDVLETLKIADSDSITVYDKASGEYSKLARGQGIDPENEAMIPSVADLMSAVSAFPEHEGAVWSDSTDTPDETGGDMLSDCSVKLVRDGDETLYYVTFVYNDLGIQEEYYVSLNYRVIISAATFKSGERIYSYDIVRASLEPEVYGDDALYTLSESAE